jgi:hypothetical protein
MNSSTDKIVGAWCGTAKGGLSRITIDLKLQGEDLTGAFCVDALVGTQATRALDLTMTNLMFDGQTLSFRMERSEGPAMVMKLLGENEALFSPGLDPEKLDLSDPDTIRAMKAHQVILFKS